jgi:hypothetical protein
MCINDVVRCVLCLAYSLTHLTSNYFQLPHDDTRYMLTRRLVIDDLRQVDVDLEIVANGLDDVTLLHGQSCPS